MKISVSNKLYIENPTEAVRSWAKLNLVLANPEFHKKERMGKWTGNTPRTITLYETVGDDLILPFGCLQDIWRLTGGADVPYQVKFGDLRRVGYESNINTYPYQEKAVKAILERKNGVVVMPCGSGKTQTALEAVARIGGRCLWLTHTQDLLNQSLNRAKSVYGLNKDEYGMITGGKVAIGSAITFSTIQTLCKVDLDSLCDRWDVIIVDECQHCCGSPTRVTQFYKVLSRLSARYKIGLTATPKRADGLERSMFALLGNIICEVTREDVADTTCEIRVETHETGYMPDYDVVLMGDGTLNYNKLIDHLIHDEDRFEQVSDIVNALGSSVLVLGSRVDYISRLSDAFDGKSVCLSTLGQSKTAKEMRKKILKDLDSGEIDAVFATYALAREGLDVPSLRYVVFATPEKDPTTIEQSIGRVGRKAEGKPYGTVIDFVDEFGMYKGWYKKRLSVYKKIGYDIIK